MRVLVLLALCIFTNEAAAGGHGNGNEVAKATAVDAPPTTPVAVSAPSGGANAEVAGYAKKIEGLAKDVTNIEKTEGQVHKVATELHNDLAAVQSMAQGTAKGPMLGEAGPLGTKGKKPKTLGEADFPNNNMRTLRDKIEADVKHDIWSKEIAADEAAQRVKAQAKKVISSLMSREELGESSILHDSTAPKQQPSMTPVQAEQGEVNQAKAIEKAASVAHVAQVKAKEQTQLIAKQYTAIEKTMNAHAGELAAVSAGNAPAWLQQDVTELGSMVDESTKLTQLESKAEETDKAAGTGAMQMAQAAEQQFTPPPTK